MSERKAPAPIVNIESKPFWDATAEGKLLLKKCNSCNEFHWYPRSMCPFCHSMDTVWVESAGKCVIYSHSTMRRTPVPYCLAYVTLDEGTTMMTNLVDVDFDSLEIGQKVEVSFADTGEGNALPYFTTV